MATTQKDYQVNVGGFNLVNLKVVETLPPNSPFAKLMSTPGSQTTPALARGNLNYSAIQLMNGNLAHACDFKFIFNLNFDTLGLVNPVEAIQKALQNAKLKATNRMRALLKDAAKTARAIIDKLLDAFGLDPSGSLSLAFSIGKDLVRKVNEAVEYVAEKIEEVAEWIFFAQQIKQLIDWIQSLPEKLKNMLLQCLSNFTNSIKQIANTFKSIPDQIASMSKAQVEMISAQFAAAATLTQSSLTDSLNQSSDAMPTAVAAALSDASVADSVTSYINSTTPSSTDVNSQATDLQKATSKEGRP